MNIAIILMIKFNLFFFKSEKNKFKNKQTKNTEKQKKKTVAGYKSG